MYRTNSSQANIRGPPARSYSPISFAPSYPQQPPPPTIQPPIHDAQGQVKTEGEVKVRPPVAPRSNPPSQRMASTSTLNVARVPPPVAPRTFPPSASAAQPQTAARVPPPVAPRTYPVSTPASSSQAKPPVPVRTYPTYQGTAPVSNLPQHSQRPLPTPKKRTQSQPPATGSPPQHLSSASQPNPSGLRRFANTQASPNHLSPQRFSAFSAPQPNPLSPQRLGTQSQTYRLHTPPQEEPVRATTYAPSPDQRFSLDAQSATSSVATTASAFRQNLRPTTLGATLGIAPSSSPYSGSRSPRSPTQGYQVRALWDCTADQVGDLEFSSGEIITVLKTDPNGWWIGQLNGRTGSFPANYVCQI